jgi:hypothetical protein
MTTGSYTTSGDTTHALGFRDVLQHVGAVDDVEAMRVERDGPEIAKDRGVQVLLLLLANPERVSVEIDPGQDEVDIIEAVGPAAATASFQDMDSSLVAGVATDLCADDLIDLRLVGQNGDR